MNRFKQMTDVQLQDQLEIYQYGDNQLIWEVAKRFAKRCYELNTLRQSVAGAGTIQDDTASLRSQLREADEAITRNWTNVRGDLSSDYCIQCGSDVTPDGNQTGQPDDKGTIICNHQSTCIVLKSTERLKEGK
jgi:hypothetical protein